MPSVLTQTVALPKTHSSLSEWLFFGFIRRDRESKREFFNPNFSQIESNVTVDLRWWFHLLSDCVNLCVRVRETCALKRGRKVKQCLAASVHPFNLAKSYKC